MTTKISLEVLKNADKKTLDKMYNYTIISIHENILNYNIFINIELDSISNEDSMDEFYRLKFTVKENAFYTKFTSYLNIILCLTYFNDNIIRQDMFKKAILLTQKVMYIFEEESIEIFSNFIKETFDELIEQTEKMEI